MSEQALRQPVGGEVLKSQMLWLQTLRRVLSYTAVRLLVLFLTVVVGVFLTILIANMGGYVDKIRETEITERVYMAALANPEMKKLDPEVREAQIQAQIELEKKRYGLDQPFLLRSVRALKSALMLNLGRSLHMTSDSGSKQVRLIILERLPPTLLLFGTADLFLFFLSLFVALMLSRQYGSFWDRMIVALSPLSAGPGWFYGLFLIVIFASALRVLPFGGMVDAPPPPDALSYALSVLKHLILPVMALTISSFFLSTYSWRTFFLIYSTEDYVEVAQAKGIPPREIERRYILRPTLPTIVTSFALTLISLWTGAPIFETVFNWPGLGRALYEAVGLFDIPVIVASTVLFAYLLAITVFLLDVIYALLDPRVKLGGQGERA